MVCCTGNGIIIESAGFSPAGGVVMTVGGGVKLSDTLWAYTFIPHAMAATSSPSTGIEMNMSRLCFSVLGCLVSHHAKSLLDGRLDFDGGVGVEDAAQHFLRLRTLEPEGHESGQGFVVDVVDRGKDRWLT